AASGCADRCLLAHPSLAYRNCCHRLGFMEHWRVRTSVRECSKISQLSRRLVRVRSWLHDSGSRQRASALSLPTRHQWGAQCRERAQAPVEHFNAATLWSWTCLPSAVRSAGLLVSLRPILPYQLPSFFTRNLCCSRDDIVHSAGLAGGDCIAGGFRGRAGARGDHGDCSGESLDEEHCQGVQEGSDSERRESDCKVGFGNIQVHSSRICLRCPRNLRDTAPIARRSSHSTPI